MPTIYFGNDNSRPASLADLAGLLGVRDQQLVSDAVKICCPARPGEAEVHRILQGDSERLRAYVSKHKRAIGNPARREFVRQALAGQLMTR